MRLESGRPTFTYFFLDPETARLKIGKSVDVSQRLRTKIHEVGVDLIVVATIPRDEEKALHSQFSHARLRGEWFNARDEALAKYILDVHGYRIPGAERKPIPAPAPSVNDLVARLEEKFEAPFRDPESFVEWLEGWEPKESCETRWGAEDGFEIEGEEEWLERISEYAMPHYDFEDFLEDWQEEFIGWGLGAPRIAPASDRYTDVSWAFWRPTAAKAEDRLRTALLELLGEWDADDGDSEALCVEPYFVGRDDHQITEVFPEGVYAATDMRRLNASCPPADPGLDATLDVVAEMEKRGRFPDRDGDEAPSRKSDSGTSRARKQIPEVRVSL